MKAVQPDLRKKEFTSFDVTAVVRELKTAIIDSRVNNIYQLAPKTLLLKLHQTDKPAFGLILEAGKRLHLTAYAMEKPLRPPAFCMAMRKYLRNARLTGVEQYEFERVITLSFKTQTGHLWLILELFGDGNIILVSENNEILQALTYKQMRDRNILRGETFKYAPSGGKNPLKIDSHELFEGLRASGDVEVVRTLTRFLSIGGVYAEEILLRAGVDKTKACSTLTEEEVKAVFDSLQSLLSQAVSGTLEPCVVLDETGAFVDVLPIRLKRYEDANLKLQPYNNFNAALDEFYSRVSAIEQATASEEIDGLKREAERLKRIITEQEKVLQEAESKTEQDRHVGDVIYAHIGELQALLDKFSTGKQNGKEWKVIVSEIMAEKQAGSKPHMFFESLDTKNLHVNVCVDDLTFGLDLRKTLYEDAAGFYERGKRAKQKLEGAQAALADSKKKLEEVEAKTRDAQATQLSTPSEVEEELEKHRIKHKEWFEKFRWFISSDGLLVVAGKDAVTNEVLIKKYTEDSDIVFHADIIGAPFVVIKTEGKTPSDQCLHEAGEFAAAFSRGWREGFGSVDVYWVKPEQLSKGGSSGESVAHGAFVVHGQRNWIRGVPLRTALGIAVDEEMGVVRIGGGPVDSVKAKTNAFVVIVPGNDEGKQLFKHILKALVEKTSKELREAILELSTENIREFVPYGKGAIQEN